MDLSPYRHTERIMIAAPPEDVYALVADVTRMGDWSPVCTGGEWDDDKKWFTGRNAIGEYVWETRCRVEVAEPGKEFAFVNGGAKGDIDLVRWGFSFTPADGGTEVVQSWEVLPAYEGFVREGGAADDADVATRLEGMKGMAVTGMAETLAKVKAAAEQR